MQVLEQRDAVAVRVFLDDLQPDCKTVEHFRQHAYRILGVIYQFRCVGEDGLFSFDEDDL
jgi:hypothetical protein